jgi:hypothetical protein
MVFIVVCALVSIVGQRLTFDADLTEYTGSRSANPEAFGERVVNMYV